MTGRFVNRTPVVSVRFLRAVGVAVAAATMVAAATAPAHAADPTTTSASRSTATIGSTSRVDLKHGCKVLKRTDLEAVFGGTVTSQGEVRRGPDWLCRWNVAANGERPAGPLKVNVAFKVPPGACDALSNNPRYEVIDDSSGLGNALFEPSVARLTLCKGKRVLVLQGVFNDASVRPIRTYDAKGEFIQLAAVAQDRL